MRIRGFFPAALVFCWLGWSAAVAHGLTCRDQLLGVVGANQADLANWIDQDTPDSACTKQMCTNTQFSSCNPAVGATPKESLVLVFSDEFEEEGRKFGADAKDARWTAMDLYYFPTQDQEVYKPEQVTTKGGAAVITVEKRIDSAVSQQPDGTKWDVHKAYASGFVEGWQKFCFTGGYLEASVKLPGDPAISGFWPAFWTMGNLGRAGYMQSTTGFWPYSYNTCSQGSEGQPWSKNAPQVISACPDPPGFDRGRFGMAPGVGRGAPEFDVFEISIDKGVPHASQTLQMAPLLPQGTNWLDAAYYQSMGVQNGVYFPGQSTEFATTPNSWWGSLSTPGQPPRPGNVYQDSISALSFLNPSFYSDFHKWGVDWKPGEYLRWYIDDVFVYEINKYALMARQNATGASVGERLIPLEPLYIIFNLGISEEFGFVDYENLPFPSQMLVDYVRVYQSRGAVNVGCSPPAFPTAQYIACNKGKYTAVKGDDVMITETCSSGAAALWRHSRAVVAAALAAALALLVLL